MGQFSKLLDEARANSNELIAPELKEVDQKIVLTPKKKINPEKDVNLGIKIPRKYRDYWSGKAKLSGRTIKSVLIEALIQEFGNPPN